MWTCNAIGVFVFVRGTHGVGLHAGTDANIMGNIKWYDMIWYDMMGRKCLYKTQKVLLLQRSIQCVCIEFSEADPIITLKEASQKTIVHLYLFYLRIPIFLLFFP